MLFWFYQGPEGECNTMVSHQSLQSLQLMILSVAGTRGRVWHMGTRPQFYYPGNGTPTGAWESGYPLPPLITTMLMKCFYFQKKTFILCCDHFLLKVVKSFNCSWLYSDDVKQRGAGKRSKYYQKYGNPNFGGIAF